MLLSASGLCQIKKTIIKLLFLTENIFVMQNPVRKRRYRDKPMRKWTFDEETKIIDFLIANTPIETPTARLYYGELINIQNWTMDYNLIRQKVMHMKRVYYKMLSWRLEANKSGNYDSHMIREHLKRRCPHFAKLHILFSVDPRAARSEVWKQPWKPENDEMNLSPADISDEITIENLKVEYSEPDLSWTLPDNSQSETFPAESEDPLHDHECAEGSSGNTMEMRKEEMSLEWMRLEIEKEKLSIMREKIALQRDQNQEMFKIKQLEEEGAIRRLQIEKDAEVRKYELSLKYKAELRSEM